MLLNKTLPSLTLPILTTPTVTLSTLNLPNRYKCKTPYLTQPVFSHAFPPGGLLVPNPHSSFKIILKLMNWGKKISGLKVNLCQFHMRNLCLVLQNGNLTLKIIIHPEKMCIIVYQNNFLILSRTQDKWFGQLWCSRCRHLHLFCKFKSRNVLRQNKRKNHQLKQTCQID